MSEGPASHNQQGWREVGVGNRAEGGGIWTSSAIQMVGQENCHLPRVLSVILSLLPSGLIWRPTANPLASSREPEDERSGFFFFFPIKRPLVMATQM